MVVISIHVIKLGLGPAQFPIWRKSKGEYVDDVVSNEDLAKKRHKKLLLQ